MSESTFVSPLKKVLRSAMLVMVGLGSMIASVEATPITYNFEGRVDVVPIALGSPTPFNVGDTITGSFTYESSTAPFAGNANQRVFHALTSVNFSVGTYSAHPCQESRRDRKFKLIMEMVNRLAIALDYWQERVKG